MRYDFALAQPLVKWELDYSTVRSANVSPTGEGQTLTVIRWFLFCTPQPAAFDARLRASRFIRLPMGRGTTSFEGVNVSKGWLSRLVGSESAGAKSNAATAHPKRKRESESAAPTGDPFSGLRERGLVFLDDPKPAESLPAGPPPATSMAELLIQLAAHEATASSPDARALLELLAEGSDVVVRPLPAAAQASLAMCDDPNLTVRELAEKLSTDLALVQALLRTANSAAFGAGKNAVLSIGAALDRIGIASARSIIFANAVDGVLSRPGGHFNTMASAVWNHMMSTAPLARALAPAFNADPEEAFAIALLHDIGKLVVFDRISTLRSTVRRDPELPASFVRDLLNDLHESLGAAAM